MNIHELPMDKEGFLEAYLDLELDINITAGEVDRIADDIVAAASVRGLVIKRSEAVKDLKARFAETKIRHDVLSKIKHDVLDIQAQVEINPRRLYPNLLVAEALTDEYQNRVRKNVRRFLCRRGSAATRKYLEDLCSTYPEHGHVFTKVLGEMP